MRTESRTGTDARTARERTDAESEGRGDADCRPGTDGDAGPADAESGHAEPVTRATRLLRLAKLAATTLGALVGIAKALGWL